MSFRKTVAPLLLIFLTLLALSYAVAAQALGVLPQTELRPIAAFYLRSALNYTEKTRWTASPQVVSSIIWDYRGLDTLFETAVFFLAVISCVALFRLIPSRAMEVVEPGLSLIAKVITKVLGLIIIGASASIALHGQLTPGGGFQAGAALAVLPLMFIMAMSRALLEEKGIRRTFLTALWSCGLLGIGTTLFLPLIIGALTGEHAYLMQNQIKPDSRVSMPEMILGRMMGGSLLLYNVAEYLAVAACFTLVFLLLSLPEDAFKKILEEEKYDTY